MLTAVGVGEAKILGLLGRFKQKGHEGRFVYDGVGLDRVFWQRWALVEGILFGAFTFFSNLVAGARFFGLSYLLRVVLIVVLVLSVGYDMDVLSS